MSATVWMEIVCVRCANTARGEHAIPSRATLTAKALCKEAKEAGWKDLDDWYCPRCARALNTDD